MIWDVIAVCMPFALMLILWPQSKAHAELWHWASSQDEEDEMERARR